MSHDERTSATGELEKVQRWMQAVITHPLGITAGAASPAARREVDLEPGQLESIVLPGQALSAAERLAIYGNAYYARLLECMRELFPALVHALGEELFNRFALGYLQQYPPRGYSLGHLADHFVQFLEQTRPAAGETASGEGERPVGNRVTMAGDWPDFVIDLARLESTIDQVFDGPGVEQNPPLTVEQLTSIPADRWPAACLEPVVCLRLLSFKFPVNAYYTAFRRGEDPPVPAPRESFAAITRREYVVRRFELSKPQYELLAALASGRSVGEAVARSTMACDDVDQLAASLRNWFRIWSANGFFARVRSEPAP